MTSAAVSVARSSNDGWHLLFLTSFPVMTSADSCCTFLSTETASVARNSNDGQHLPLSQSRRTVIGTVLVTKHLPRHKEQEGSRATVSTRVVSPLGLFFSSQLLQLTKTWCGHRHKIQFAEPSDALNFRSWLLVPKAVGADWSKNLKQECLLAF